MSKINDILGELKEQVLNLLDDILMICPDESDILFIRLYFENQINAQYLMDGFIKNVKPHRHQIDTRNESFFDNDTNIFGPLPQDKVQYFKQKFKDGTFDEDDKDVIWRYFTVFLKLMDKYEKIK